MLGAPRSRSPHARRTAGGAGRLPTSTLPGVSSLSVGLRSSHRLQTVYDERYARAYGRWRPVVGQVADKFLACEVLDHVFTRIRCDPCANEYLMAFSCKCGYFCPSCHAKRLAIRTQWLDTTLLAPVPHRQVVLTITKRLRA